MVWKRYNYILYIRFNMDISGMFWVYSIQYSIHGNFGETPETNKPSLYPCQVGMTFTHGSTRLRPDNDGEQKRSGAVAQCLGG